MSFKYIPCPDETLRIKRLYNKFEAEKFLEGYPHYNIGLVGKVPDPARWGFNEAKGGPPDRMDLVLPLKGSLNFGAGQTFDLAACAAESPLYLERTLVEFPNLERKWYWIQKYGL